MSAGIMGALRALPRPARFLLAGGSAAAINWLVRFPLSEVMPFIAAVVVAAVIGMAVGFVLYRHFVFAASRRPLLREARDFLMVNLATTAVVTLLAAAFLALGLRLGVAAGMAEAAAHAIAIGLGAVLNYVGHSLATFAPRPAMRERRAP